MGSAPVTIHHPGASMRKSEIFCTLDWEFLVIQTLFINGHARNFDIFEKIKEDEKIQKMQDFLHGVFLSVLVLRKVQKLQYDKKNLHKID
jgi:hypothetical protein